MNKKQVPAIKQVTYVDVEGNTGEFEAGLVTQLVEHGDQLEVKMRFFNTSQEEASDILYGIYLMVSEQLGGVEDAKPDEGNSNPE